MPKFVVIIGPQAVGKMTVGQELSKLIGYKLLYNHMTIEMVRLIFDYDKSAYGLILEKILKKKKKKQISGWNYLKNHM